MMRLDPVVLLLLLASIVTPVHAAEGGIVLFSGEQRGYGNIVLLAHDNDLVTVYAHNAENLVSRGDHVSASISSRQRW